MARIRKRCSSLAISSCSCAFIKRISAFVGNSILSLARRTFFFLLIGLTLKQNVGELLLCFRTSAEWRINHPNPARMRRQRRVSHPQSAYWCYTSSRQIIFLNQGSDETIGFNLYSVLPFVSLFQSLCQVFFATLLDFIIKSKSIAKNTWQTLWNNETKGRTLYKLKPIVSSEPWFKKYNLPRRSITSICRLRTGHSSLAPRLSRIGVCN